MPMLSPFSDYPAATEIYTLSLHDALPICTIPKGTSKKVFEMLNHRLHVAHAPHRWYALEEKEHGVNQLRVVGGVCDCCLRVAMQFYDGAVISTIEEQQAEASTPKSESIEAK